MHNPGVALCLFGSYARGTADATSDKDLLVVCDDARRIPDDTKRAWAAEGWSPAYYSWDLLRRKAVNGDLLLHHLKREGKILEDPEGKLQDILRRFEPRSDYSDEINRAMIMLRPADRRGGPPWQQQYLCGLVYEFARHAVLHLLASRQVYVFGYAQCVAALAAETGQLDSDDVALLLSLRQVRSQYKARQACQADLGLTLDHARTLASRLFGFEFLDIPADADVRMLKAYSTLRDMEARILARHDPRTLDRGELLPDIWKLIQKPKLFHWARNGHISDMTLQSINDAITASFERG